MVIHLVLALRGGIAQLSGLELPITKFKGNKDRRAESGLSSLELGGLHPCMLVTLLQNAQPTSIPEDLSPAPHHLPVLPWGGVFLLHLSSVSFSFQRPELRHEALVRDACEGCMEVGLSSQHLFCDSVPKEEA